MAPMREFTAVEKEVRDGEQRARRILLSGGGPNVGAYSCRKRGERWGAEEKEESLCGPNEEAYSFFSF